MSDSDRTGVFGLLVTVLAASERLREESLGIPNSEIPERTISLKALALDFMAAKRLLEVRKGKTLCC